MRMGSPYGPEYERAVKEIRKAGYVCVHCGQRRATSGDHYPPLSLHRHVPGTGCCRLLPSCTVCYRRQGGELSWINRQRFELSEPITEPLGFDVDADVWDEAPWLDELRDVPDNATWPRLMSLPHPDAVGSYGARAAQWAKTRRGEWRWWQKLFAYRLLEHDGNGELVWLEVLLTVARQVGKSRVVGDLVQWRTEDALEVFGEPQDVVCTGKDLAMVRETLRWHRGYCLRNDDRYKVMLSNGQEQVLVRETESRYMLRSTRSVYGLSSHMTTVDESWAVGAAIIDDGVVPLSVSLANSQVVLLSTAHRKATALMIGRRTTALDQLGDPLDGPLIVEWSAPPECALDDKAAWRMASPWWDTRRERLIQRRMTAVLAGESEDVDEPDPEQSFRSQWLNQWPQARQRIGKGEPLLDMVEWASSDHALPYTEARGWVALEDNFGKGAACGMAVPIGDGVYEVGGDECESWHEAQVLARKMLDLHPRSRLLVGASMVLDPDVLGTTRSIRCARADTQRGLSLIRSLVKAERIVHDATSALDTQIAAARVVSTGEGLRLVGGTRADLLKCVVWALRHAENKPPMPKVD